MSYRKIFDYKNNKMLIIKNRKDLNKKSADYLIDNYVEFNKKKVIPENDDFLYNMRPANIDNYLIKFIPKDYDGLSIEGIIIKPIRIDNVG